MVVMDVVQFETSEMKYLLAEICHTAVHHGCTWMEYTAVNASLHDLVLVFPLLSVSIE